jgi:hypothetical protein
MTMLRPRSTFTTIAFPVERRSQLAMPRTPSAASFPVNSDRADGGAKEARVLLSIGRPATLAALAVIIMSLTSCAGTGHTAFLGPAYDGPTAAYGYNIP